ncbi:DUF2164 domain-containing protein [Psychrobium sp. 1_MG-2023]|uniref:DUF2164 domain-containing protein n=1 Tax=Psychrobium sp. 1_MG-2023 TaxID=3062624 RepID=UPI000C347309|nr:DUF2164 domain-containing protein [Psychrobium sp. 1_MG-2023]MDP2562332.1 DUF2164 domain-containing protein [Psychrobium sp. 1_MG-2023]PKF58058.1 DUF2164 domain-containing protein [Alteromonadales bacterium alter-6D02]
MSDVEFTNQEKEAIVEKLQSYFEAELQQEIGQFDAEFLLDFFSKEVGGYYYNRGLHDARAIFESKIELIDDDIYAIEKEVS